MEIRRDSYLTSSEALCAEKPACSAPWLALESSAWSQSRHWNFSSSRRYMHRTPRFVVSAPNGTQIFALNLPIFTTQ